MDAVSGAGRIVWGRTCCKPVRDFGAVLKSPNPVQFQAVPAHLLLITVIPVYLQDSRTGPPAERHLDCCVRLVLIWRELTFTISTQVNRVR